MNLSSFYNTLITNFSAADRIFDILDQKPIVKNSQAAKSIGKINGTVELGMFLLLMIMIMKY